MTFKMEKLELTATYLFSIDEIDLKREIVAINTYFWTLTTLFGSNLFIEGFRK